MKWMKMFSFIKSKSRLFFDQLPSQFVSSWWAWLLPTENSTGQQRPALQCKTTQNRQSDFCKKKSSFDRIYNRTMNWLCQWYWKWQECKNFKNLWVVMPNSRQMEIVSIKWIYSHWIRSDRYHLIRDQTGLLS